MLSATSTGPRRGRNLKPIRARLGRTWQDRNWRMKLLRQLPPKAAATPPEGVWARGSDDALPLPQIARTR
jgi:hypothetical protein